MPVYLVRHTRAGNRSRWKGDDFVRPLTPAGRAQAEAITRWLWPQPIPRLLSSPYVRCVQTLEPLAGALDLKIEESVALTEGGGFEPVLGLLDSMPDHAVLCSHGDVILATMEALFRRGLTVVGCVDWRKGATWVLERQGGAWVSGQVVPAP